ncbi:MAG TPA: MBL fold metallo-hydrolase [Thermoanaerobaculaceae bacterium]|nr:MBL fold metallo-hydrolase [Thermoanaerobaculaceae bacterium]HPS77422.1 MBL fold metallo-hydrolase [Thermoanaerobaculaceae bacterium]
MRRAAGHFFEPVAVCLLLATMGFAQTPPPMAPDLGSLADGHGAQVFNRKLTAGTEDGRAVARLDAAGGDGGALLDGVQVSDGVIEVDLRGKDVAQQSFLGIAFHWVDWTTYDAVYFRPFNFRAAEAEQRSHSVQYVSQPANPWQKLRAERPGQFEKAIEPPPDPNGRFHARIVVAGGKVEVYVNNATAPCLAVEDLGEAKSGGVALWAGNGSDGAFASLKITPTAPPGPPPVSKQPIGPASATGNLARVRALVEADPTVASSPLRPGGPTPLHLAAANGQRAVVEYLLGKGADVNAVARHAGTPLDLAWEAEEPEMMRLLEARGGRLTPVRLDVTELAPSIHRVAFGWGMRNNILVFSGSDGAVVVDSGFTRRALDELKKTIVGFSPAGVRTLINSHNHGDHVAGNAIAPSPASVITAATLASPPAGLAVTPQAEPLKGKTGRTLPLGFTLRAGGAEITLIPRPGLHSPADLIVYFPKESVVAMGDLLLSESVPAVEDIAGYLAFLDDVLDVFPEGTVFVSGHGRDLTSAGVNAYRDDLVAMIGIVRANLTAGRTPEQMVQDDLLKAYKARYSLLDFLTPDALIPRVAAVMGKGTLK